MPSCKVEAILNQKVDTGKTTMTVNLGAALALMNKKVLLVDANPQGNLTTALGWKDKDNLEVALHAHGKDHRRRTVPAPKRPPAPR